MQESYWQTSANAATGKLSENNSLTYYSHFSLKSLYQLLSIALLLILTVSCSENEAHFLKNTSYRQIIEKQFNETRELAINRNEVLFSVFDTNLSLQEKEALMFLYSAMPLNDLADYSGEYFLKHVQFAFRSREEFSWSNSIPDEIFRHFVLPHRVNNENLDDFRWVYFEELKSRVEHLDIESAAMEINHWCHERVSYQAADIRTSAPMATLLSGRGRCGEQSTLLTTALRTVGIPARQVYVPRWAHTDDNHAWVEIYIDGKWKFTGGCEPAPALNEGWFVNPAQKAMLVHTKAYGLYDGKEEIIKHTPYYSELNLLKNYAKTRTIRITVINEHNELVSNALVKIGLYNYAEFYPLASFVSNQNHAIEFTTGYGDLLIEASKGNKWAYLAVDSKCNDYHIALNHLENDTFSFSMDFSPPSLNSISNSEMPLDNETCQFRLLHGDSLRNAYKNKFLSKKEIVEIAKALNTDTSLMANLIMKSEGNSSEILHFIRRARAENHEYDNIFELLQSLASKDLRDTPAEILLDHLNYSKHEKYKLPKELFNQYVLSPRISNEIIVPWRSFFLKQIDTIIQVRMEQDPLEIIRWVTENISINQERQFYSIPASPIGVFNMKQSDTKSRDIFFVALARTFAYPARIAEVNEQVQIQLNRQWMNVSFDPPQIVAPTSSYLKINLLPDEKAQAAYYQNFSIAAYRQNGFESLDFGYYRPLSETNPFALQPGYYRLLSGIRTDEGEILCHFQHFIMTDQFDIEKNLVLRNPIQIRETIGQIAAGFPLIKDGEQCSIEEIISAGEKQLFIRIDPEQEPGRHLINELNQILNDIREKELKIHVLIPAKIDIKSLDTHFGELSNYANFYYSPRFNEILLSLINEKMHQPTGNLPSIVGLFGNGEVFYYSEGYEIGRCQKIRELF